MSHYAKVVDGKVTQVIVAEPEFFETFVDTSAGEWIQTSYNTYGNQHPNGTPLRGNYAGIGFTYDKENDVFIAPKPFDSWILDTATWLWKPPIPIPQDQKFYNWNEESMSWVEII
jgi:hypothetical protein